MSSLHPAAVRVTQELSDLDSRLRSFRLDEAVRLATAGKCYKPAAQWSFCAECAQPCSSRERVAVNTNDGTVRHERCR